jgi:hypothetical protein
MSYTISNAQPTGGVLDDLYAKGQELLGVAGGVVAAGKAVLEDPYLPEVTSLVMRLQASEQKSGGKAGAPSKGVGLKNIVTPLRFYVTTKENPIVGIAAVAGILAVPFLAGYLFGKSKR